MSRYIVEWHEAGEYEARSDSVEIDQEPGERLFAATLAGRYGLEVSDVKIYMWLLQNEPRNPLTGRWGSIFKN